MLNIILLQVKDYEIKDIAKKLQISEEELQSYFDKGYDGHKYRTSNWAYKIGIKIYQILGLDHRIRK